jgi:hypothetical protein
MPMPIATATITGVEARRAYFKPTKYKTTSVRADSDDEDFVDEVLPEAP